jgi:GTPase SAR1 family protein
MLGGFKFPKRPALGNIASLGTFYDARTDTFVPISLLRTAPAAAAVTTTDIHKSDVRFSRTDTYTEKFKSMGVNADLSASVLAGLVNVEGSGRYLLDKRESNLSIQAALHYDITTVQESLNFFANEIKESLAFTQIDGDWATHVVAEIVWGAQNIVTLKRTVTQQEDRNEVEGQFTAAFDKLKIIKLGGTAELENESVDEEFTSSVEVTVYGDVLANDGLCPIDLHSAFRFLRNVPTYVAAANNGKGKPLMYTLLPLPLLKMFYNIEITAEITLTQLSAECLEEFVQLFDECRNAQETLNGYCSYVKTHRFCVPEDHIRGVDDQLKKMRTTEASVKTRYAETLKSVRAGKADAQQLWALIEDIRKNDAPDFCLPDTASCIEKVEFIELMVSKGATYVGFDGGSLDLELAKNRNIDTYTLYFDENTRGVSDTWANNVALILQLLEDKKRKIHVVLVDCDVIDMKLAKPEVHLWRQGHVIMKDVAEEWGVLANLSTMRYPEDSLDRSEWGKPVKCAPVKILCPGLDCVSTTMRSWICLKCRDPVMFSYANKYLYCQCGRWEYHKWEFRCEDPRHGVDYQKYDDRKLLQFLENLEPFDELNLLILGQTGVGKSTWINAFVNYLTFPTLDEAIKAEKLESVIPCSFSIQKEVSKQLVSVDIQVGFSAQTGENGQGQTEADGSSGQSATQSTQVYAMLIGNRIVRVIDTPGIGDTRGLQQDKKNMADILKVLPTYENLHGILILLKSNEARLDVMFSFCIKELLTHLHRNAVRNIVFGFTNTRNTSYNPGDTFKPLQSLVAKV